jgi:hypothetical protein
VASDRGASHGLSPKTLLIAGASSAAASVVVPMIWQQGTVLAAAITPIIVAVVSALLERPVDTVAAVAATPVKKRGRAAAPDPTEPFDPLAPPPRADLEALNRQVGTQRGPSAGAVASPPSHSTHRRRRLSGRQWRLAIVTGLVAFVAAAAVVTFLELATGDAVTTSGSRTSLFGGSSRNKTDTKDKEQATPTPEKSATPTPDEEATETPTPSATPTPGATATPSATTAAPSPQAAPPAETPAPTP